MEDKENNPMWFILWNTYANTSDKALTFGNLKWKFHSIKINWETHVFSIPSMIFNNSSDLNIIVDQPTIQFSVSWEGSLPEAYVWKSEASEEITFTAKLLYRGPNCWVETDQEIVNFLSILRDSFNYEPFLSNPEYKDIFNDYDILRNNLDDFDTLKKLWLKINKLLDCNIKSFKTVDIFPTQCGYEQLNFERVENGFDIATQSCLFSYEWDGNAIVRDNIWVGSSKWLNITPNSTSYWDGRLKYRVFSYIPMKLKFDYKMTHSHNGSNGYMKFFINDIEYLYKASRATWVDSYDTFTTPLLGPW
jgi:hypothetical protein